MKKIVILTGAGMSAESGISTFRGSDGLWEGHEVQEVASPEGFAKNPELVLEFYNQRRKNLLEAKPNEGHVALAELEANYEVKIITQNVDDLHERAGSTNVLHLHGELFKVRSSGPDKTSILWKEDLNYGNYCADGFQLRPDIVWFGEMVPNIEKAISICGEADYFIIIGTSLAVYPAASLIDFIQLDTPKYIIDPNTPILRDNSYHVIKEGAVKGIKELLSILNKK
jgi:NAD-dependent deacetylase